MTAVSSTFAAQEKRSRDRGDQRIRIVVSKEVSRHATERHYLKRRVAAELQMWRLKKEGKKLVVTVLPPTSMLTKREITQEFKRLREEYGKTVK